MWLVECDRLPEHYGFCPVLFTLVPPCSSLQMPPLHHGRAALRSRRNRRAKVGRIGYQPSPLEAWLRRQDRYNGMKWLHIKLYRLKNHLWYTQSNSNKQSIWNYSAHVRWSLSSHWGGMIVHFFLLCSIIASQMGTSVGELAWKGPYRSWNVDVNVWEHCSPRANYYWSKSQHAHSNAVEHGSSVKGKVWHYSDELLLCKHL